jgi:hypothetical protein
MRLYNQNSRNPVASVGLDAKKLRPVGFLSPTFGKPAIQSDGTDRKTQDEPNAASNDDSSFHSATTASESHVGKCEVVRQTVSHDEFLFDIKDGDVWSTDSSSTLSTQASLRNNLGTFSWPNQKTGPTKMASVHKPSVVASPKGKPAVFPGKGRADLDGSNDLIPIPELSFTESSSEDATDTAWFDFSDNPTTNTNTHDFETKLEKSHSETSIGVRLYPVQERMPKKKNSGLYSKYTTMLVEGAKAKDVKAEMEKDAVDQSIIELMMAAAETTELF